MAKSGFLVMDCDLHMMEPSWLFEKYLEDQYQDRAPVYVPKSQSPSGVPHWNVLGRPIPPWAVFEEVKAAQTFLSDKTRDVYRDARRRGYDAVSHLNAMNIEGIDVAILFRSGAHMITSVDDLPGDYAIALCRAFNNWLADYRQEDPARLLGAGIITLHDPELAAAEARRCIDDLGFVSVVLLPSPVNGRHLHAPECDVIWAELERLGVPIAFHGTSGSGANDYVAKRFVGHPNFRTLNHASSFPLEMMLGFGALAVGGVLERFPGLKVALLEANCGWLPWWLHRLDDQWKKYGGGESVRLSALPSEYFKRQCFISTDVDEELLRVAIEEVGDDNIVVSTDYPHNDGAFPHAVEEFLELPGVSNESKRKILWDNCVRLYGLADKVRRFQTATAAGTGT